MVATVPHVSSGSGLRKFQADGLLFNSVYGDQQMHNYLTNYRTLPTCFDTIVSSSGSS